MNFADFLALASTALSSREFLFAGSGLAFGALASAFYFFANRQKLVRDNIALYAQLEANKEAWERAGDVLDQRFKVTAQDALTHTHEQFLQLAQERLKNAQADGAHDLEIRQKAIEAMVSPVQEHLKALSGALEQVKGTDHALREDLKSLSRETAKLVGALRDPSAQGVWGEFILEGVLDKSGLMKGLHYETQVSIQGEHGRQRPDAVIRMQDGFNIIVDAKAPLNEFSQKLSQDLSEAEHQVIMQNLAKQVREHVKKLGSKNYWESMESPDFTVLFLPSEHMYSMALRADPSLVDLAVSHNVIIASPTLLMSLLRVVHLSWRQVELAQNAKEISECGYELYKRFLKFTEHFEKIGKGLQSAMGGYDAALGSMERQVLPAARKFKDLQSSQSALGEIAELQQIETQPRTLNLNSVDEQEKLRA